MKLPARKLQVCENFRAVLEEAYAQDRYFQKRVSCSKPLFTTSAALKKVSQKEGVLVESSKSVSFSGSQWVSFGKDNVIERTPEDKERIKQRSEMVVKMLGCEIDENDNFEVKDRVTVGELLASLGHKIPGYPRPKMGPCFTIKAAGYEWTSGVDEGVKMVKEGDARELVGLKNSGPLNFVEIQFKGESKVTRNEKKESEKIS